ncbi:MAG: STAS domain-containing protein [Planctomycetota bacterium]|jgi:anti-sigma B factor antagonist
MASDDIIRLTQTDGIIIAQLLRGAFRDENGVLLALEKLGQVMKGRTEIRMVLDLGVVEYVSSAGLGRLVACLKRARESGGDLFLASVRSEILELLDLMKLTEIFTVHETVDAAKDALLDRA